MERSYIGVAGQNVPLLRKLIRHYRLPAETGVLVASLESNSPATRAGIVEGDIIITFDERPVVGVDSLHKVLTGPRSSQFNTLGILRGSEHLRVTIAPVDVTQRKTPSSAGWSTSR